MRKLYIALAVAVTAAVAANATEYKSLGTGLMTDDMVTNWYGLAPVTYAVEIQQGVDNPALYRVIAPYGQTFADAMLSVNNLTLKDTEYDKAGTCVLDLDATNPDSVYFAKTMIGADWGDGPMYIGITTSGNVVFKDSTFTSAPLSLAVGDDTGAVAMNRHNKFRILLPGVQGKDYDLSLTLDTQCLTDRNVKGSLVVGNDVAAVKYAVMNHMQEDEMLSTVDRVAEQGADFDIRGNFAYEMDKTDKETLIVVALDADGKMQQYAWKTYYYVDPDINNPDWEDCGDVEWCDYYLPSLTNVQPMVLHCKLQRNVNRRDYLRLVNPYAEHPAYQKYATEHAGHPHYMYIAADDPDCIFVEESPVCMDFGAGMARIGSMVDYFLWAGYELEECKELECGATIDANNRMTFPFDALTFSMLDYDNGDWYNVEPEDGNDPYIQLPADFKLDAGVDNIVADTPADAATVYYNMQGMRVNAPVAGQIYIKRQGTTATKLRW